MECLHVWVYLGLSTSPSSFVTIQQILFGDEHPLHLTPGLPPCQHHQHSKLPQRDCILEAVFVPSHVVLSATPELVDHYHGVAKFVRSLVIREEYPR